MKLPFIVWAAAMMFCATLSAQPQPTFPKQIPVQRLPRQPFLWTGVAAANQDGQANTNATTFFPLRLPFLYGIAIVTNRSQISVKGIERYPGLVPPEDPFLRTREFEKVLEPYFQKPISTDIMKELQKSIIRYYLAHERRLVDVLFERQDISNGMLQITVLQGTLGKVEMRDTSGNAYTNGLTSTNWVRKTLRLKRGEIIERPQFYSDLDWLNRSPFRRVNPLYTPSFSDYARTDLLLQIQDRFPLSGFAGYENTGSEETGEDRVLAGFTWGKAFGLRDNLLNYQFVANPDFESLLAHVARYEAPLPWRHTLRVFGSYVDVKGQLEDNNQLEGNSYQTSLRYEVPLPRWRKLQHNFSAGLDFKHNDNSLLFGSGQTENTPYDVFQLYADYSSLLRDRFGQTTFFGQLFYSPGDVTSLNSDAAFSKAHAFARANYVYSRLGVERETTLFWELTGRARSESQRKSENFLRWRFRALGQVSSGNLVPSEQLGLGGYATVRGYAEREANGDQGWMISNELVSPSLSLGRWMGISKRSKDHLELLFFWDYGVTGNKQLVSTPGNTEPSRYTMSSVGPGVRYSIDRYLTFRFDYGFPLRDAAVDPNQKDKPRLHVGLTLSY